MKIGPKFKGPRTPTLLGIPSPFKTRREIPAEHARYAVVLSQIEDSGVGRYVKRLFLFKEVGGRKAPTPYFLTFSIVRQKREGAFYMEVKADFGNALPENATLQIFDNERAVSTPARVVINGKSSGKIGFSFAFDPSIEKLILEVKSLGSSAVPYRLTTVLRNKLPGKRT